MVKELTFPFNLSGRTAALFEQEIQNTLKNTVQLERFNRRVNAKSLLGVLSKKNKKGDTVSVVYQDEDFRVIEKIINSLQEELK